MKTAQLTVQLPGMQKQKEEPMLYKFENHTRAYWEGGSEEERLLADIELLRGLAGIRRPVAGFALFILARLFGAPWMPFRWRWGHGMAWPQSSTYARQIKTIHVSGRDRPMIKRLRNLRS